MKLIYLYLEEDYKNIKKGTYKFDNEFNVVFDLNNKIIQISKNESYYDQFENSIESISCIVGQNGMGKTTFLEILISFKLWRLDGESHREKIHALFYDSDKRTFFIQSYIDNAQNWRIYNNEYSLKKFVIKQCSPVETNTDRFSVIPTPISFVFHSLSPFDKIYDLIKDIYLSTSRRDKHYENFGYIGINKIKENEPTYNLLTIKNLLYYSYASNKFKDMLSEIGYKFKELKIELNSGYFSKEIKLLDFEDININRLEIGNFSEDIFNSIKNGVFEDIKLSPRTFYPQYNTILSDDFIKYVLFLNLDLSKFNNFKRFLKLSTEKYPNENIETSVKNLLQNIDSINIENTKQIFDKNNYRFLQLLKQYKGKYKESYDLLLNLDEYFNAVNSEPIDKFYDALRHIIFFQNNEIITFQINLIKDGAEINFLRLSSGEKTLLSYIFNIYDKILNLQVKTADTDHKKTSIVLIDEVELHLHPEWQRRFVYNLNKFFGAMGDDKKVQFIIATHSPIVLSDILSQNTIYLKGDVERQNNTFGGNIFDIYKNNFFLEDTIGEFSKNYIENLAEFLNFIKAFCIAKNFDDLFLLKSIFQKHKIKFKKDENYIRLSKAILIDNKNFPKCLFCSNYLEKYRENRDIFLNIAQHISENIGEDIIRDYLLETIDEIKRFANEDKY